MIGGLNPYPRVIGGAPSEPLKIHDSLRRAVGGREGGGASVPFWEGGLEDGWRWAKALMIARASSMAEQALLEFLPHTAEHSLQLWEDTLGVLREPSQQERRDALAATITVPATAVANRIQAYLQENFDAGITVGLVDETNRHECVPHKALADRTGAVPFGPDAASSYPNYTNSYELRVTWPGLPDDEDRERAERYLRNALPAWMDYQITNGVGFVLGATDGLSYLGRRSLGW